MIRNRDVNETSYEHYQKSYKLTLNGENVDKLLKIKKY